MRIAGFCSSSVLVSAQWDPWRDPAYRKRLATDPDLGTVRRIDGVLYGRLEDV